MKKENTIYDFLNLLNEGYQKAIDSDYKEPNLATSSIICGKEVLMKFNYWLDEGLNSNFNHLDIKVILTETNEILCAIQMIIIDEFNHNDWDSLFEDCDSDAVHLRDTFENIFCDSILEDELYDDFLDYDNCPIWINLNHFDILEKYRGKGYGQEILKYIIHLLGLNSDYTVARCFTTEDIVFSVYPYPISAERDCPIEDFDLKLKMVQNFYKKVGFNDFKNKGYYVYNKK